MPKQTKKKTSLKKKTSKLNSKKGDSSSKTTINNKTIKTKETTKITNIPSTITEKIEKSDNNDLSKDELVAIKEEIETLFTITKGLQTAFNSIENVVNGLTNSIKLLGEKAKIQGEMMSNSIKKIIDAQESTNTEEQTKSHDLEIDDKEIEVRQEVDEENFNILIKDLLKSIRKEDESRDFIRIKEVKSLFQEKYIISDDKFQELLMESHWNQVIELLAGTGDFKIKDHFGNIYHNINLKDL